MDQKREYKTDDLVIHWDSEKCTHACTCWQTLPQVFKPKERPWVNATAASPEEIIKTIDLCPSRALTYSLPEGSKVDPALARGFGAHS